MPFEIGYDAGIDYKNCGNLDVAIAEAWPGGVDVYFDNTSGPMMHRGDFRGDEDRHVEHGKHTRSDHPSGRTSADGPSRPIGVGQSAAALPG